VAGCSSRPSQQTNRCSLDFRHAKRTGRPIQADNRFRSRHRENRKRERPDIWARSPPRHQEHQGKAGGRVPAVGLAVGTIGEGWLAGLLSFYNFTYYRHYHTWHHRYTQDPEKDPELMDPKPTSFMGYAWEISGIGFWLRRPLTFLKLALTGGRSYPFVPEHGRVKVAISASLQLAVYVLAGVSIALGYPYALWYFFLPAILAQPLLRALLIVEHTGCSYDEDGLTNTRTTLTNPFIRLLMWNMPFHTEHHLYPSIPFHQLPAAHREIKSRLAHLSPSYVAANREVIAACHPAPTAEKSAAQETAVS